MQTYNADKNEVFHASETSGNYELQLQNTWNNLDTLKDFSTSDHRKISIHSTGTWNFEAGPDFKDARIMLDGKMLCGPVEIHSRTSDWFAHGHHNDPAYRKVILHVAEIDDLPQEKSAQLPPLLIIAPEKQSSANAVKIPNGKCALYFSSLGSTGIAAMLTEAGLERFHVKSSRLMRRMLLSGAEYNCLKMVFEAVGYKKNRECFIELFERFMEYDRDIRDKYATAIIWGESGLLPDPADTELSPEMLDFVEQCWSQWWQIRLTARPGIDWNRAGRPANSPERRIAAIIAFVNKYQEKAVHYFLECARKAESAAAFKKILPELLTFNDSLWDKYLNFTRPRPEPAAVMGSGSALELAVNVILPAVYSTARINNDSAIADKAKQAWLLLPSTQDNRITRDAAARWFNHKIDAAAAMKGAAARQGVIHLFNEYCNKCQTTCGSCLLYNSI